MSVELNKRVFVSVPELIFNTGDLSLTREFFAEDYVERASVPPGWPEGIAGFEAYIRELRSAFPDFHGKPTHLIGEGDLVAGRLECRGTHLGSFLGMPASGKVIEWTETHIGRFENGKIVEHWVDYDQLGTMTQMGIIPQPEAQPAAAPNLNS